MMDSDVDPIYYAIDADDSVLEMPTCVGAKADYWPLQFVGGMLHLRGEGRTDQEIASVYGVGSMCGVEGALRVAAILKTRETRDRRHAIALTFGRTPDAEWLTHLAGLSGV